jgi:hypothetical protein
MTEDEARLEEPGTDCPVCQWPGRGTANCPICGWEMIGGYVAGAATPADHQDLATRLGAARQQHDVRAAVRAVRAGGGSDPDRLSWLARCARGGGPSPSHLERISAEVAQEDARRMAASDGMDYALVRLVAGEADGITFVEVGPDFIASSTLVADSLGRPRRRPGGGALAWSELLTHLPAEIDLARFLLAGGIGAPGRPAASASPAAFSQAAYDVMATVLTTVLHEASGDVPRPLPDSGRGMPQLDVVLVRRICGWPVLDAMIEAIWAHVRPVTEIYRGITAGSLVEIVDQLAARAPLRHAYDLVLLSVDGHTGAVDIDPCELFPAGTVTGSGDLPEVRVDVLPPPHAAGIVELPIVARRGDNPWDWPRVDSHYLDVTSRTSTTLRVSLDGPGQLTVRAAPALSRPPTAGSKWPQQARLLPSRLRPVPALDVAFLVELGGYTEASVARRVRLVRELIGALDAAAMSQTAVEIALVGYRDHFGVHSSNATDTSDDREKLVVDCGLTTVPAALDFLNRPGLWQAVQVQDDYAAPVEDALRRVARGAVKWRRGARHLLFVVGSRPPHPHAVNPGGLEVRVCRRKLRWRRYLTELQSNHEVECVLVVDDPPPVDIGLKYIEKTWQELPAAHRFAVGSADPAWMVQAVGLVPDSGSTRLGLAMRARYASTKGGGR